MYYTFYGVIMLMCHLMDIWELKMILNVSHSTDISAQIKIPSYQSEFKIRGEQAFLAELGKQCACNRSAADESTFVTFMSV